MHRLFRTEHVPIGREGSACREQPMDSKRRASEPSSQVNNLALLHSRGIASRSSRRSVNQADDWARSVQRLEFTAHCSIACSRTHRRMPSGRTCLAVRHLRCWCAP